MSNKETEVQKEIDFEKAKALKKLLAGHDKKSLANQVLETEILLEKQSTLALMKMEELREFKESIKGKIVLEKETAQTLQMLASESESNKKSFQNSKNNLSEMVKSFGKIVQVTIPEMTKSNAKLIDIIVAKDNKITELSLALSVANQKNNGDENI